MDGKASFRDRTDYQRTNPSLVYPTNDARHGFVVHTPPTPKKKLRFGCARARTRGSVARLATTALGTRTRARL